MSSKIEHRADRSVISLPNQGRAAMLITAGVFLAVGLGIGGVLYGMAGASSLSAAELLALVLALPSEANLVSYVFGVIALACILVPIAAIFAIVAGRHQARGPAAFIFDHAHHRFVVAEQGEDPDSPLFNVTGRAGYDYSQILELGVRHYTTTSSSSSGSKTTNHYVVCFTKRDGSRFDLYHSYRQADADALLSELQPRIDLSAGGADSFPAAGLESSAIVRWNTGQSLIYCWQRPSHFARLIISTVYVAFFALAFLRIGGEAAFPFQVMTAAIAGITALSMLKGLWDGIRSARNYHALRLISAKVEMGLIPKAAAPLLGTAAPGNDLSSVNAAFRVKKSLPVKEIARVQFNYETGAQPPFKLTLAGESAARSWENVMSTGKLDFSAIITAAKAGIKDTISIELPGLRMSDLIRIEANLEEDIRARGGAGL